MSARKRCRACRRLLSDAAFNGSGTSADGLASTCRACINARRRELDRGRAKHRSSRSLGAALDVGGLGGGRRWIREGAQPEWCWIGETMRGGHIKIARFVLRQGVRRSIFTMAAMAETSAARRRLQRAPEDARRTSDMEPGCERVTP